MTIRFAPLVIVLLLAACQSDPLVPARACGDTCVINREGFLVVGDDALDISCNVGRVVCEDGIEVCEGWVPFGPEVCDPENIDEDCDGEGNNIRYTQYDYRNTCEGVGACASADLTCTSGGDWTCRPTSQAYGTEVCDGVDNDCDGLTDASDPDLNDGAFSYSGPPETVNVGECRAGVARCIDGRVRIHGEVLPTAEICGNNDDDDCDGFVDESDDDEPVAIMLVIDFSGSMEPYIVAVINALCGLANEGLLSQSQFAAIAVAGYGMPPPYTEIISDWNGVEATCQAISEYLTESDLWGAVEYTPHAIRAANIPGEEYVGWPGELSRQVIFFTDEEPQGFNMDPGPAMNAVVESCADNKYSVSGFNNIHSQWAPMVDGCGGWQENLLTSPDQMINDIQQRFIGRCE